MRSTTLDRRHNHGFMTAQEIQKMLRPQAKLSIDDVLAKLKYRLDHPRFLERDESK